jgi:hypothetical protein
VRERPIIVEQVDTLGRRRFDESQDSRRLTGAIPENRRWILRHRTEPQFQDNCDIVISGRSPMPIEPPHPRLPDSTQTISLNSF